MLNQELIIVLLRSSIALLDAKDHFCDHAKVKSKHKQGCKWSALEILESYSLKQNLVEFVLIFALNTNLLFYKIEDQIFLSVFVVILTLKNGFVMLARMTTKSRFFVFQMHPYQGFLEIGYHKPSVDSKGRSLFKILEIRAHEIKTNQAGKFFLHKQTH